MAQIAALILAGGLGTRMKSRLTKVMHRIAGRPMIAYPVEAARSVGAKKIVVVRNPKSDELTKYLKEDGVESVVQREAKGTAHAIMCAKKALSGFSGYVLVLCGDTPLLRAESLGSFVSDVAASSKKLGFMTMILKDPAAYGRVIRDLDDRVVKIVEALDATPKELSVSEVNSGIYCVDCSWLFDSMKKIGSANAKGEYYLTDLVGLAVKEGAGALGYKASCPEEFLGINSRVDLAVAAELMRERINKAHMLSGVGIVDCRNTYIDADVRIGVDTTVMPFTFLKGRTKIGSSCIVENGVVIEDSTIGNGVHIKAHSVIEKSEVANEATVGPFSRIRPDSKLGRKSRVGNFVEIKKAELKEGVKANHLTYLGDALIGEGTNVGCGTITCNYDGAEKHRTIIGKRVFIGSDTQFVAPVRIGSGATVGAGSTIVRDVPPGALALSRAEQKVVKGWASKKKCKKK